MPVTDINVNTAYKTDNAHINVKWFQSVSSPTPHEFATHASNVYDRI